MSDPIADLIADVAAGAGIGDTVYAPDVAFDATVPHWRFRRAGSEAVRSELAGWYADPGTFEDLQRIPVAGGELVTWTLTWTENGVPHTARQAHLLAVENDRISRHQVWCGGRWPAELVAEMAGA